MGACEALKVQKYWNRMILRKKTGRAENLLAITVQEHLQNSYVIITKATKATEMKEATSSNKYSR